MRRDTMEELRVYYADDYEALLILDLAEMYRADLDKNPPTWTI